MIGVDQTIFADPVRGDGHNAAGVPGDCWRACIASLLELPTKVVPHFLLYGEELWWHETLEFVRGRTGLTLYYHEDPVFPFDTEYLIGSGPSPRGDFHHAVILRADGTMAHDPHPLRSGLKSVSSVFGLAP